MSFSPEVSAMIQSFIATEIHATRTGPDDSFVQKLYDMISSSGYKITMSKRDPMKEIKKRFKASCEWNKQNRFDEVHPNWVVCQSTYGKAYCDEPLRDESGHIIVRFDFNEAIALAESTQYEAITKTTTGYRICKNSIPIVGQSSKPGQSIMVWVKKSDFVFPNDRTVCVANKGIAKKRYAENRVAHADFIIATQTALVSSAPAPVAVLAAPVAVLAAPAPVAVLAAPAPTPVAAPAEDSEDEEVDVEAVEIDGKMYYKDENDVVYDQETGDEVGTYTSLIRESQKQAEIRKKKAIETIKNTTKKIIQENNIINKHQFNIYCNMNSTNTSRTKIYRVVSQRCPEAWTLLGDLKSEQFCGSQFRSMVKGFSEYKD